MSDRHGRRAYRDGCAASHALNLMGDRWALLIVRELMLGPKRFSRLRRDLPGLSANILTQRLEEMASAGIVQQQQLPAPADVRAYVLTSWGRDLWPVIAELVRWGIRSADFPTSASMSATSFLLSLRAFFDPDRAKGLAVTIGLNIGADSFGAQVEKGRITVSSAAPDAPDAVIAGDTGLLKRLFYGREPVDSLQQAGLTLSGDVGGVEDLVMAFPVAELRAAS
jgi:DNA-binding HxlR family transcriptional regulator|tara:strand:+ start:90847 stop:91518 length:672 start_codon:yes stop_codon:yes gene_type:complete